MRRSRSIVIDRPVEEVFAYVDDPAKTPEWAEGMVEVRIDEQRPRGIGSTFQARIKEGAQVNTYDGVVVAYEPNKLVSSRLSTDGKNVMLLTLRLQPQNQATEVTQEVDVPIQGPMVLILPLIWIVTGSIQRKQLRRLKEILEER